MMICFYLLKNELHIEIKVRSGKYLAKVQEKHKAMTQSVDNDTSGSYVGLRADDLRRCKSDADCEFQNGRLLHIKTRQGNCLVLKVHRYEAGVFLGPDDEVLAKRERW